MTTQFNRRLVLLTVIASVILTMLVGTASVSAAYCASGETFPNRGWVKNVNTPEVNYVFFYGQAGTIGANCNSSGSPLYSGQDSNIYTDDADGYRYSNSQQWTVSHGLSRISVTGNQQIFGLVAVWCNRDTGVSTALKIRCDW